MAGTSATSPKPRGRAAVAATVWPTGRWGWVGLLAAAIGLGSWLILPLITSRYADRYPVTDTFVMPVIGLVLTTAAAVVNMLVVGPGRQRSLANVVAACLTVAAAVFFGLFVVGEGLAGS